jgi:hypothetical protein
MNHSRTTVNMPPMPNYTNRKAATASTLRYRYVHTSVKSFDREAVTTLHASVPRFDHDSLLNHPAAADPPAKQTTSDGTEQHDTRGQQQQLQWLTIGIWPVRGSISQSSRGAYSIAARAGCLCSSITRTSGHVTHTDGRRADDAPAIVIAKHQQRG